MKQIFALTASILCALIAAGQQKIKIEAEQSDAKHFSETNKFYFVHHLVTDAFFRTDLNKVLSYDEMAMIVNSIYCGVTEKDLVTVTINQATNQPAKLVFFSKKHPEDGLSLVMMTNFVTNSKTFSSGFGADNSLTRWYFIRGNKLVHRDDLYSKSEKRRRKRRGPNRLIDFYLFDDNAENDSEIKPLIDELMNESRNSQETFFAKYYLIKYWLREGNLTGASISIDELRVYIDATNDLPIYANRLADKATAEYEILKRMKN